MLARIGVHPPAKVSRQLAQSLFCQRCVGKELVPPGQQPSAGLPQRMIPAHRNAISAVVGALKSIGQVARQVVCSCHVLRLSKPAVRRQANLFFPALSGKKCVLLCLKISPPCPNFSPVNLGFTHAKKPRTESDGPVIPSKMLAI